MGLLFVAACLIFAQHHNTLTQAAPSIEACPHDSILFEETCICDLDSCVKPPCLSTLAISTNGSDAPGSCCPTYSCIDCRNETLIDGQCPCAIGATINAQGLCECTDRQKHLVDGECVCDPMQCELPQLCDRKSVLVTVDDGCCKKTKCQPCPEDSESTNLESDDIEDHCVCLPCKNDCGPSKSIVIKTHGTNFPGSCCDLYECKPLEEKDNDCTVGANTYSNGDEWSTSDMKCKCQNGVSLCARIAEEEEDVKSCFIDGKQLYKHNETWTKEDGCTQCTCLNGEANCISHYCDFKESQIKKNESQSCFEDNQIYLHLESWTKADDQCTFCTCFDGKEKCDPSACKTRETYKKSECQPLFNCNKTCSNGFKINKKGCEICKCNVAKILDDYKKQRTETTTTTSVTTTTTTTSAPTVIFARIVEATTASTTTTTEPSITPADKQDPFWIYFGIALSAAVVMIVGFVVCFLYRNKRKNSIDLSHCQYKTVNTTLDNNNTIKKTNPLL